MTSIRFVQLDILIEKSAKRNKKTTTNKPADLCQQRPFSAHSVPDLKDVFKTDEVLYESF